MPKIEPFEKFSDEYDAWFNRHVELYEAELAAIRQFVPASGAVGMEIGVGSGKFAVPLGIAIGVEPSPQMALKARKQGIDVRTGVAEALPFPDGQFDFVLMVTTICFVDDIVRSFREAYRVLNAQGFIVVAFVDKETELGRQYLEKKERSNFYRDAVFYSTSEVLDCLKIAGFATTETRQTLIPGELPGTVIEGYGSGAFVVIKGTKSNS